MDRIGSARIRLAVLDAHVGVHDGFRALSRQAPDLEVVAAFTAASEVEELVAAHAPDLLVVSNATSDGSGLLAVARVTERWPELPIVAYVGAASDELLNAFIALGVGGIVEKGADRGEVLRVIRVVAGGGCAFSPFVCGRMVRWLERLSEGSARAWALTPHDVAVLALAATGSTNREIGRRLAMAESTVKWHMRRIEKKLEAPNRAHAVAVAIRLGLV